MEIKGIVSEKNGKVVIESDLEFLDNEYFNKNIKGKSYSKLKDKYWAIKSGDKYIIDEFDGVEILKNNLEEEANIDFLTGCVNKKETETSIETFLKQHLRYKTPFSILMFDIDFFKKVNDTYGHLAGDFILKELAKIIQDIIRESDICGRFGGEEFLVLLPNTKMSGALKLAKRMRKSIEDYKFKFENQIISITMSIGITSASKNDSVFSLIERVDDALYKAKHNGRNRIEYE